jgi:hypothetical protein
MTRREEALTV